MSMLEQAIVDAKDLREVAKANAEAEVLEKYSSRIKEAVDHLLELDDEETEEVAGMDDEDSDEDMVTIDLDKLEDDAVEVEIEEAPYEPGALEEEIDLSEADLLDLVEKLTVDTSAQKSGWASPNAINRT